MKTKAQRSCNIVTAVCFGLLSFSHFYTHTHTHTIFKELPPCSEMVLKTEWPFSDEMVKWWSGGDPRQRKPRVAGCFGGSSHYQYT